MRNHGLWVAGALAALASMPASAHTQACCGFFPTGVYRLPPVPISDARKPIYMVNQGPVYSGPALYGVSTYSEGDYTYTRPYPYVRSYWAPWRYGYRPRLP